MKLRVYLDDCRPKPEGFDIRVLTAQDAIDILAQCEVEHISLDHDLGNEMDVGNGYMVAKWIEEAAYLGTIPRLTWAIHSQNSVGVASMRAALTNADKYWAGA